MDIRNYFTVTFTKKSKNRQFFDKPKITKKKKTPIKYEN